MLVDEQNVLLGSLDPILMLIGDGGGAVRLQQGVYQIGHYGSSAFLAEYEHYPELTADDSEVYLGPYGVCDGVDNLLAVYPILVESPRQFVVTLKCVRRDLSNKGKGGGWRWHKWGAYIGSLEPTTEYLDDEPEIEQVFCYHIYERK